MPMMTGYCPSLGATSLLTELLPNIVILFPTIHTPGVGQHGKDPGNYMTIRWKPGPLKNQLSGYLIS